MGKKLNKTINTIDLFAGCGGLTDGFEQEGNFHLIAGVEWTKPFCETLVHRLKTKWKIQDADKKILHFDIQRTNELINGWKDDQVYGSHSGLDQMINKKKVNLIIGGPPCQAYSVAGRIGDKYQMREDYRNFLFESYLKVVEHYKPSLFLFENVTGILSAKPGGVHITDRIRDAFNKSGYEITKNLKKSIFDVSEFGVPQYRKRIFIVGIRRQYFRYDVQTALDDFYLNIVPSFRSKRRTVKDAIADLPPFYPKKIEEKINNKLYSHEPISSHISNHFPRYHSSRDIGIFTELARDVSNGGSKYKAIQDLQRLYTKKTGKFSNIHKYYVLRWNEPSNTIVAHLYKDGLRHIHPDYKQARSITVREAGRLQSFDDNFKFLGSMGHQYQMIGNAVPPMFAKVIAHALNEFIVKYQLLI